MKFKKLIIPATVISLAIPTVGFSCLPVMAEPASAETVADQTGDGSAASLSDKTQTSPPSSSENSIKTQSDATDTDDKFTGEKKENGVTYYYENGKKFTGNRTIKGIVYYYKDGVNYTGTRTEDGIKYYYTDGVKTDKYITIEGTSVKVPLKGNKWINLKGYWHFIKDGVLIKGWRNLNKADGEKITHWSFFDKTNGRLYTGWKKMGKAEGESKEHYSYFGTNGWLRTGWQYMGTKTNPDGKNKAHWSYFGKDGWLTTGWKYFTSADGEKTPHWSYFGGNGWLRTGWQTMGKGTSNSYSENSNKHMSYFGSNGWLQTGWKWFTSSDGEKKNHWSYFGGNGWLAIGYAKVNNVHCTFSGAGWLNKTEMDIYEYVDQEKDGYHQGCAGASLLMALKMKGKIRNMSYVYFMEKEMPYATDGNPNHGYIGNPKLRGSQIGPNNRCAILSPALALWGQRYHKDTSNISGCSVDKLIDETRKGSIPVVMVTYKYEYRGLYPQSWGLYLLGHHFNTMVGYDYVNDKFKVADPNTPGTGQGNTRWVDGNTFRRIWNIQKGAILLK